jgi:hypothetical protein
MIILDVTAFMLKCVIVQNRPDGKTDFDHAAVHAKPSSKRIKKSKNNHS